MSEATPDHGNHAGPYGFTRREIVALASIIVVCIAVVSIDSWRDSRRATPGWLVQDVLIDESSAEPISHSFAGLQSDTTITRDHSDLIDINSADANALARLPGIGTELARRIIDERSSSGRFTNLTDLQRVRGIGPRKAAMLSGWVKFTSEPTPVDTSESE